MVVASRRDRNRDKSPTHHYNKNQPITKPHLPPNNNPNCSKSSYSLADWRSSPRSLTHTTSSKLFTSRSWRWTPFTVSYKMTPLTISIPPSMPCSMYSILKKIMPCLISSSYIKLYKSLKELWKRGHQSKMLKANPFNLFAIILPKLPTSSKT